RGLVASSAGSSYGSPSSSNSSAERDSSASAGVLAFACARSATKTTPYPSAANSRHAIAAPIPVVIQTAPKPNPTAPPTYRNELPTVYLLVVRPWDSGRRGRHLQGCAVDSRDDRARGCGKVQAEEDGSCRRSRGRR